MYLYACSYLCRLHLTPLGTFGEISYSLVGEKSSNFYVEPDTGTIIVQNNSALDREVDEEIVLTAVATDRAPITTRRSTTVPVHLKIVDQNDNSPVFTKKIFHASVAENAALNPPAAILQVRKYQIYKIY